jgi:hypothetical protein
MLSAVLRMTGSCHHAQQLIEMGSSELCVQAGLEPWTSWSCLLSSFDYRCKPRVAGLHLMLFEVPIVSTWVSVCVCVCVNNINSKIRNISGFPVSHFLFSSLIDLEPTLEWNTIFIDLFTTERFNTKFKQHNMPVWRKRQKCLVILH